MKISLLTDLYEFTMAQIYVEEGMEEEAVFEFFVRPDGRRAYYVMAGTQELLKMLREFRFEDEEIEYLERSGKFGQKFLDYLKDFRFSGDVWALREGEIFLGGEPVVSVRAPLPQAQLVETILINTLQHPILVATKAARCVSVAQGTTLVDFGLRRAQGKDAGIQAARSSYIAGFVGTSNVLAGKEYGIPVFGTMAHSFVMAHESEEEAFERFMRRYPDNSILLVDTYDTIEGTKKAIAVAKRLGIPLRGVRLDSGDIETLATRVRQMLDSAGFGEALVLVSGGVDEFVIADLLAKNVPIDAWGVGTKLVVSEDMPSLDCAYKLVEYAGKPRFKKSRGKVTLPAQKQIKRVWDEQGFFKEDLVEVMEAMPEGLLHKVMERGQIHYQESLDSIRQRAAKGLRQLPPAMLQLRPKTLYLPRLGPKLSALYRKLMTP